MKLKVTSAVTIISTGTHFFMKSLQNCLEMGENHKITDDMIVEIHILQTD